MGAGVQIGRGYIAVDVDESKARAALSKFGSVAATAFKAVGVAAAVGGAAIVKMAFDFNSLKEQSLIAFETLLGSGQKAQAMFGNLQKFAASTPFELPGLVDNARQLLGVGISAEKVIPTLTSLGNAAGALGINQERFNNILLATTQAFGKGKLQGEELMQMVENGIPVWQLLAKATGKTVPELQKMSEQGKLIAQDVLPKLFDQMQKDYGGAMSKQATTLTGVWSSLKDNTKSLAGTALAPLFDLVKAGVGRMGELAQSEGVTEFATRTADGLKRAGVAVSSFTKMVKKEYGDDFKRVFDTAAKNIGQFWDVIKEKAPGVGEDIIKTLRPILPAVIELVQALGGILKPAIEAIRSILSSVAGNAEQFAAGIRTAATVAGSIAGPAIKALGEVIKVVAGIIGGALDMIGTFAVPLGVMAGAVLAAAAAWRLFSTVVGKVQSVGSGIAGSLSNMAKSSDDVALRAGVMTEKLTKSADAGTKVATAGGKVGTVLRGLGNNLPLIGLGFAALAGIWGLASQHAEDLAKNAQDIGRGIAVGGQAAKDAAKKLADLEKSVVDAKAGIKALGEETPVYSDRTGVAAAKAEQLNTKMKDAKTQIAGAAQALKDYQAELGPVGLAQAQVEQATKDYNKAVMEGGVASAAAVNAQGNLVAAQRNLDQATRDSAAAAKDKAVSLRDMASAALEAANADLALRQAQAGVSNAVKELTRINGDASSSTEDRKNAELNLESALLRSVAAAQAKARADNQGKDASIVAKAETAAYSNELLRLAREAGTNAPASLQRLVGGLTLAELQAIDGRIEIDKLGNAIIKVPGQKDVRITAENAQALYALKQVQDEQDRIKRDIQIRVTTNYSSVGSPVFSNTAQQNRDAHQRARGGPISGGQPYLVGEEGPEWVFPSRDGFVATHQQSQQISSGMAKPGAGGDHFTIYDASDPYGTALYIQRLQRTSSRLR